MNFSTKFAHHWHKKLWNWLAENPGKYKHDWPEFSQRFKNIRIKNNCFCCTIMLQRNNIYIENDFNLENCKKCLLRWPGNKDLNVCEYLRTKKDINDRNQRGLFTIWEEHNFVKIRSISAKQSLKKASQLARAIRDLPFKDYESDDGSEVIENGKIITYNGIKE